MGSCNARLEFFRSWPELVRAFQDEGKSVEQAFRDFKRAALSLVRVDTNKTDFISDFVNFKIHDEKGVAGPVVLNDFVEYAVEHSVCSGYKALKNISCDICLCRRPVAWRHEQLCGGLPSRIICGALGSWRLVMLPRAFCRRASPGRWMIWRQRHRPGL